MVLKRCLAFLILVCILSCSPPQLKLPITPGDPQNAPTYGYTPIDPLPVKVEPGRTKQMKLDALPDETVRIAVGRVDYKSGVSYGPASLGVAGNSYVVVIDYAKCTTLHFGVKKSITAKEPNKVVIELTEEKPDQVVPVYVGVGLRLTANVTVNEGSIDLGNLFIIGAAAQAKQISGSLVVQSLGLSGPGVSSNILISGDLSPTSLQNAIQALGAIKAQMYDGKLTVVPRAIAVYNNLGGGQDTVNFFISSIMMGGLKLEIPEEGAAIVPLPDNLAAPKTPTPAPARPSGGEKPLPPPVKPDDD